MDAVTKMGDAVTWQLLISYYRKERLSWDKTPCSLLITDRSFMQSACEQRLGRPLAPLPLQILQDGANETQCPANITYRLHKMYLLVGIPLHKIWSKFSARQAIIWALCVKKKKTYHQGCNDSHSHGAQSFRGPLRFKNTIAFCRD